MHIDHPRSGRSAARADENRKVLDVSDARPLLHRPTVRAYRAVVGCRVLAGLRLAISGRVI
jgi:hypothetical protein